MTLHTELTAKASVDAAFKGPGGSVLWANGRDRQQLPASAAACVYYAGFKYVEA